MDVGRTNIVGAMNNKGRPSPSVVTPIFYVWIVTVLGIYLYQFKSLVRPLLQVLGIT